MNHDPKTYLKLKWRHAINLCHRMFKPNEAPMNLNRSNCMVCHSVSVREDNPWALSQRIIACIDTKPYNRLRIAPACIFTLCISKHLTFNIGILMKGAILLISSPLLSNTGNSSFIQLMDTGRLRGYCCLPDVASGLS